MDDVEWNEEYIRLVTLECTGDGSFEEGCRPEPFVRVMRMGELDRDRCL
jgi:hypothetical protein